MLHLVFDEAYAFWNILLSEEFILSSIETSMQLHLVPSGENFLGGLANVTFFT